MKLVLVIGFPQKKSTEVWGFLEVLYEGRSLCITWIIFLWCLVSTALWCCLYVGGEEWPGLIDYIRRRCIHFVQTYTSTHTHTHTHFHHGHHRQFITSVVTKGRWLLNSGHQHWATSLRVVCKCRQCTNNSQVVCVWIVIFRIRN
jgi:hypothetical protein